MKKLIGLLTVATLMVLCAVPVLAGGLAISPPSVEFDVPANGSGDVEFLVYDFNGDLQISLENIPLRVEPTTVPVTAKEEGTRVVLTFYGDEFLGAQVFNGKIRFLAMTGGTVAMGIKVKAIINHIASGSLPEEQAIPEETPATIILPAPTTPATQPGSSTTPALLPPVPPTPTESEGFPLILVVSIVAGAAIVITLIVVVYKVTAERRGY